jgi:hypothetical protein
MHQRDQKGIELTHTEHSLRAPSSRNGIFATLSSLLGVRGIGAPSIPRLPFAVLAISLLALACTGAPAAAAPPTTLCALGSAAGQCVAPDSVAVDQSSGHVYVADDDNGRVDAFDSSDKFLQAFGWGVLNGAAEPQTCTVACESGIAGSGSGQMFHPSSVGVDNTAGPSAGDLYVLDRAENRVQKFTPAGEFILMFGKEVDKTTKADVCTAASGDECGAGKALLGGNHPPLAVDSSGHVWIGGIDRLTQFNESGESLSEVKLPGYGEITGLAVDASGDFYVLTPGRRERQRITGLASGTYTLTFEGQTTEKINQEDFGNQAAAALEKLPAIGSGNVLGFRIGENTLEIYFQKDRNEANLPQLISSVGSVETVAEGFPSKLVKLNSAGELLGTLDASGHPQALSLDSSTGSLYVSDQSEPGATATLGTASLLSFDSAGVQTEVFGTGSVIGAPSGNALAFGDGVQRLYVASSASGEASVVQAFSPPEPGPLPEEAGEVAKPIGKTTATLNANVNPEGASTTVHFEYVDQHSFETEGGFASPNAKASPESAPVGEDFAYHAASVGISGLTPDTAYRFRVVASNANGTVKGQGAAFTTAPPVRIDATYASSVSATAATMNAQLNPLGDAAEYHFEYLTLAQFEADGDSFGEGAQSTPVPDGSIAFGEAELTVSQALQGLLPHTAYRFRILARDHCNPAEPAEVCTSAGPVASFATQGPSGPALPDGRGWELVSPPDKGGIPLEALAEEGADIQAAGDGSGLAYAANGPIDPQPAGNRSLALTQLLAHRSAAGWSTEDIATPHQTPAGIEPGLLSEYHLFSADLSHAILEPVGATPLSPLTTEHTPYLRQPDGSYTPLVTAENVPPGTKFGGTEIVPERFQSDGVSLTTGSADLAHVILESKHALTPGFRSGKSSVYEWTAGALELVSQVPSGSATACGGAGPACVPAAKTGVDSALGQEGVLVRNAISADGSRAFFRAGTHLFARDRTRKESLQLDAPAAGAKGGSGVPIFQDASADGSRVFFTDESRLTADSTAVAGKPDLYMCEVGEEAGHLSCALADLSVDHNPGESADVLGGIVGASKDGSAVYFVANGALTDGEGAAHGDCKEALSQPEEICDLYRYDTASSTAKLVAVLSGADANNWIGVGDKKELGSLTARVSPNGRWLAFMSSRPLTGYDNRDARSGQPDQEVFLYDSEAGGGAGQLLCASCNPTGARPAGVFDTGEAPHMLVDRPALWRGQWLAGSIPGWTRISLGQSRYQSRYLSDAGRLFFNAHDALVPQDSNGTEDVYQYEPPGVGGCAESSPTFGQASGGCVDLISSGASGEESAFLDASETGNDVFFLTGSKLAPTDLDGALDVYDAHVCSAELPCPAPPPPPLPACEGDACQQPATPPNDPTPGSLTFQGAGNLHEVAKPRRKKHPKKHRKHRTAKHQRTANNDRRASR